MGESLLKQAQRALRQGDRRDAVQLSQQAIKQDKTDWRAWWLLAHAVENVDYKIKSLQRVLMLKPNHMKAEQMLDDLLEQEMRPADDMFDSAEATPYQDASQPMQPHMTGTPQADDSTDEDIIFYSAVSIVLVIGLVGLAALFLPTVVDVEPEPETASLSTEEVVLRQLDYMFNNQVDAALDLTCSTFKDGTRDYIQQFNDDLQVNGVQRVDTSGLTAEETSNFTYAAVVEVSGSIVVYGNNGRSVRVTVPELLPAAGNTLPVSLVQESKRWLVCMPMM
jgi:hypothetical protein